MATSIVRERPVTPEALVSRMHTLTDELTDIQREAETLQTEEDALRVKVSAVTKRAREIHRIFARHEEVMQAKGHPAPATEKLKILKEQFTTFLHKEREKSIAMLRKVRSERDDLQRRIKANNEIFMRKLKELKSIQAFLRSVLIPPKETSDRATQTDESFLRDNKVSALDASVTSYLYYMRNVFPKSLMSPEMRREIAHIKVRENAPEEEPKKT